VLEIELLQDYSKAPKTKSLKQTKKELEDFILYLEKENSLLKN
jgi:hypothetical protein